MNEEITHATSLRKVADIVEAVESIRNGGVGVSIPEGEIIGGSEMTVDVDIQIPLPEVNERNVQISTESASISDDGLGIQLAIQAPMESGQTTDSESKSSDGSGIHLRRSNELDEDARDLPPYRDPDTLQEVYDQCNTFTEMRDELDVDVTSQTVRKYMIEYGIHEPSQTQSSKLAGISSEEILPDTEDTTKEAQSTPETPSDDSSSEDDDAAAIDAGELCDDTGDREKGNETASEERTRDQEEDSETDGETESEESPDDEQLVADGLDLPDGITPEELKKAVQTSTTLYEVQRQMDIDRERARRLLEDLDLLKFVHGRISTASDSEPTAEEINERIRTASLQKRTV